jgi:hypothetical protein
MSHEEAFQALKDGDFRIAIPLLEHAVRESGYSSDAVNQAYTEALYRAGEKTRLADAAFEIGDSLVETDPAAAMDYFQRAFLGGLDASCVRHVGDIFERWANPPAKKTGRTRITKVAHVIGCLTNDHSPARQLGILVKSLRAEGIESQVFTTEWAASWFFNPPGIAQTKNTQLVPDAVIGPVKGNFVERAESIASTIRGSGAQVAFYHADLSEQITTRVAALRPLPLQLNVAHGSEMDPALFDGYVHLSRESLASTRHRSTPSEWIPASSDIEERLRQLPENMRQVMGIEEAETVSATVEDLRNVSDPRFLDMLTRILTLFPKHFHVFAGSGDVKSIRAHLHSEGVLPRVRFMGSMSDADSVMAVADVYLAPFLGSSSTSLLDAMGAGKPVVVVKGEDLPGVRDLEARSHLEYGQVVQRLLRDASERKRCSGLVLQRFRADFDPSLTGPRYMAFLEKVLHGESTKPHPRTKKTPQKKASRKR